MEVLDTLLQLVEAGVLNEAVEFVGWRQAQGQIAPSGRVGGSGEGKGRGENTIGSSLRFSKAFETFANVIKEISLTKKRGVLNFAAERVYLSIQENKFFPTFASFTSMQAEPEKPKNTDLAMKFLPNSVSGGNVTNSGNKLVWNANVYYVFFVDPEISEGHYKITIAFNKNSGSSVWFTFGLAIKGLMGTLAGTHLVSQSSGSCCLHSNGYIYCGNKNVVNTGCFSQPNEANLGLELNADKHVLYFFVNGMQIPHCVVNVPPSVYFGFGGCSQNTSAELKSFTKLAAPSVDPSQTCTQYSWK